MKKNKQTIDRISTKKIPEIKTNFDFPDFFSLENVNLIENVLGFKFTNKRNLICAFIHSSYYNEFISNNPSYSGYSDNELMENIGDSIVNFFGSSYLFFESGVKSPGEITEMRKKIVSNESLTKYIDFLDISKFLLVGKGQKITNSMKADLFESIIGAVYIDSNLYYAKKVFDLVTPVFVSLLNENDKNKNENEEVKTEKKEIKIIVQEKNRFKGTCLLHNNPLFEKTCSLKYKCKRGNCSNQYPCKQVFLIAKSCGCIENK